MGTVDKANARGNSLIGIFVSFYGISTSGLEPMGNLRDGYRCRQEKSQVLHDVILDVYMRIGPPKFQAATEKNHSGIPIGTKEYDEDSQPDTLYNLVDG